MFVELTVADSLLQRVRLKHQSSSFASVGRPPADLLS